MKCIKCGAELPEGSRFCNICGAKQGLVCSQCGAELPEGSVFCNQCGARVGEAAAPQKRRGRPPKTAAQEPAGGAVKKPLKPGLAPALRGDYSAWNQFCGWGSSYHHVAGYPEYHFILDEGCVYRLKPDETRAVLVKGLPIQPAAIMWGGGLLWLLPGLYREGEQIVYSLDPVTLECKAEADFSEICRNYGGMEITGITAVALFFTVYRELDKKALLFRLDRKTNELSHIYTSHFNAVDIHGFGPDLIWLCDQTADGENLNLIVDGKGKVTPLYKHPDVAPLLAGIKRTLEYTNEGSFSGYEGEELLARLCEKICFIDFFARKLYFSCDSNAEYTVKTGKQIYSLSFEDANSVKVEWKSPSDFSKANRRTDRDNVRQNHIWYGLLLFDGAHAAGQGEGGSNFDWLFQTPEGEVIDLGKFDRCENDCALLGDELYVRGGGWHKFHLAHDVPEARKIEFVDEE